MKGGKSKTETEVFRAFRMAQAGAKRLSDVELWAVLQHIVDKMVADDQSAVIVEHLRKQADLLDALLERERNPPPPPPNIHPWRNGWGGKRATAAPKDMATGVFNAIRLTDLETQKLSDGKVQGVFQRMVVEMVSRGKSAVVIEYLRGRADLLETMPERITAPRKQKRTYLRYPFGMLPKKTMDEPEAKSEGLAGLMAADKSMQQGVTDGPISGEDDTTPGEYSDRKYEDEKLAKATAEATNWVRWQDAKRDKKTANLETGLWPRVLDDQTNTDGGEDG